MPSPPLRCGFYPFAEVACERASCLVRGIKSRFDLNNDADSVPRQNSPELINRNEIRRTKQVGAIATASGYSTLESDPLVDNDFTCGNDLGSFGSTVERFPDQIHKSRIALTQVFTGGASTIRAYCLLSSGSAAGSFFSRALSSSTALRSSSEVTFFLLGIEPGTKMFMNFSK